MAKLPNKDDKYALEKALRRLGINARVEIDSYGYGLFFKYFDVPILSYRLIYDHTRSDYVLEGRNRFGSFRILERFEDPVAAVYYMACSEDL